MVFSFFIFVIFDDYFAQITIEIIILIQNDFRRQKTDIEI